MPSPLTMLQNAGSLGLSFGQEFGKSFFREFNKCERKPLKKLTRRGPEEMADSVVYKSYPEAQSFQLT